MRRQAILSASLVALPLVAGGVRADIRVEIEGISGELKANVLAYLSLSRYATMSDLDEDLLRRLQTRADGEVADALRPFGYYAAHVTSTLTHEGDTWISRLAVDPGPAVRLVEASVRLAGPGKDDPVLQPPEGDGALTPGAQLSHASYDRVKAELLRRALSHGYLDARYTQSTLLVDPDRLEARAHLVLETGERYRFGSVAVEQETLRGDLMRRYLRFREGDWFDSGALLRTQFALDDSAYFGAVEVSPGERDPEALTVPVTVRADRTRRNRYTFGAGYSTDQLWRVTGTWDNRLLNDRGHRFRIDAAVGTNAQSYGATYTIPVGDPALEKLEFSATQSYQSPGDTHSISSVLHAGLTQVRGRWQYVPFVDIAHTESEVAGARTTGNLIVPGLTIAQVPRGFMSNSGTTSSIIGATPGVVATPGGTRTAAADATGFYAEILGSPESLHSDVSFLRLHVRDQWRLQLAPKWRAVLRAEGGTTLAHDFQQVPVSYRFFTGGDQTVRGYAYQSLSPTDAHGQKSGGKDLLALSAEIDRDLRRDFAVAVFCDAGNALMRFSDPLAYGAGVGIRYRLPFLSVGIDLAKPLSNGGGSPRIHLNISPVF